MPDGHHTSLWYILIVGVSTLWIINDVFVYKDFGIPSGSCCFLVMMNMVIHLFIHLYIYLCVRARARSYEPS